MPAGIRGTFATLLFIALAAGTVARGFRQAPPQVPPGPAVRVSDGWYHLETCSIAVGRQAPAMPLAEAIRLGNGACPICEPLHHERDWADFVSAHARTILEAEAARKAAEEAERKRKAEEAEKARVKRLAELEEERKRRESAPVPRLSEAQVRQIAQTALAEAAGDSARFQARYRSLVRELSPDYAGPQIVYGSALLKVVASGPLARFETAVMERLRKGQLPTAVPWAGDVSIAVIPSSPDAPDVTQLVVQRSDAQRPAGAETVATVLSSTLASKRLPGTPASAKFIHSGEVVFPLSAFEPGEGVVVRVIVVPAAGATLGRTFSGLALRAIQ